MKFADFEQPPSDATPQLRFRHVLQDKFRFENAPEIPIGPVEAVFGIEAGKAFQGH
jgi:hypothetical protein